MNLEVVSSHEPTEPRVSLEEEVPPSNDSACNDGEDLQGSSLANSNNVPFSDVVGVTESMKQRGKVLYLFSGPTRHRDGVETFLRAEGIQCKCLDTEISLDHDLLDQANWDSVWKDLDEYEGRLLSPPCGTFSAARRKGDSGPQPLRSSDGPGRYGLPNLRPAEKEKVRVGNVLAIRSSRVCKRSHETKKPWMLEQPHHRKDKGKTSMFTLDEFVELLELDGVIKYTFDQCRFGAQWEKTTDLLSNIPGLEQFNQRCNHPKKSWTIPWSGEVVWAAHPPLKGRQLAIPSEEWGPHMLRWEEPQGEYLTRQAAAYPCAMNQALATSLAAAVKASVTLSDSLGSRASATVHVVDVDGSDPRPVFSLPLRGSKHVESTVSDRYSLRNIHKSVSDRMLYIGKQISNLIDGKLDQSPEVQQSILGNLGKPADQIALPQTWIDELRESVAALLVRNRRHHMSQTCSLDPVDNGDYQTVLRADFMKYWAEVVDDPGWFVADWLLQGAPAGLACDMSALDAICPRVDADDFDLDANDLFTDLDSFANYSGVDEDADAIKALHSYRDKGYLAEFQTFQQLQDFVGSKPILSKLGCIKKTKFNPDTNTYTTKNRIILDCKQSQVSVAATRTHKSILPRVSDAVHSALAMLADLRQDEEVTMLITDVVDAFWLVPLRKVEQRFFCAKLCGKFYAFLRTAQGSRGAPLTFSTVIGLGGRLVQSLLAGPCVGRLSLHEARMQIYVDDPLTVIRGTEDRTKRLAVISILGWTLLGFPLAFHKAVMSPTLRWVGVKLQMSRDQIQVEVPESKVQELRVLIDECMSSNLTSKKLLRTLIGKAMAVASVLYTWRPFLHELYAALHCKDSRAPAGCVWSKQLKHSLQWLKCFLSEEGGQIVRIFSVQHFLQSGPQVIITWDASPYGMGATLHSWTENSKSSLPLESQTSTVSFSTLRLGPASLNKRLRPWQV